MTLCLYIYIYTIIYKFVLIKYVFIKLLLNIPLRNRLVRELHS